MNIVPLTARTVAFAIFAFFFALPLFLIIGSAQRISMLQGVSMSAKKSDRWQKIVFLGLYIPLALVALALGYAGMGNSRQFRTPHGVSNASIPIHVETS